MKNKKNLSKKDLNYWHEYLKNPKDIFDKENKNSSNKFSRKRFTFDLHGFNLIEANQKAVQIINSCYKKKYSEVLLITGKGIHSNVEKDPYVSKDLSILKYSVPEFISNNNLLMSKIREITDAKIEDGGSGAFYIYLKKK